MVQRRTRSISISDYKGIIGAKPKNSGCNIYVTGKTLGTNIVASVASVYLNKKLLIYRMIGSD